MRGTATQAACTARSVAASRRSRAQRMRCCVRAAAEPREEPAEGGEPLALRRRSFGAAALVATLCSPAAQARPVLDERTAQRVFDDGRSSVVTVLSVESRNGEVSEEPLGAGVVWDQRGYVVTNYHVVARALALDSAGGAAPPAGASAASTSAPAPPPPAAASPPGSLRIAVIDPGDGALKDYPATLVGASPAYDLAVLLLSDAPPELLLPIPLGSSAAVRVGQSAFALSLNALSYGVVSGLRRPLPSPAGALIPGGALQTDATIDAGNSGGALLDSSGRLLGLCTQPAAAAAARASGPPRVSSLGFAIPVDAVRFVVPQLIAYGRMQDARMTTDTNSV